MVDEYNELHVQLEEAMDKLTEAENDLEDFNVNPNDIETLLSEGKCSRTLEAAINKYINAQKNVESLS